LASPILFLHHDPSRKVPCEIQGIFHTPILPGSGIRHETRWTPAVIFRALNGAENIMFKSSDSNARGRAVLAPTILSLSDAITNTVSGYSLYGRRYFFSYSRSPAYRLGNSRKISIQRKATSEIYSLRDGQVMD